MTTVFRFRRHEEFQRVAMMTLGAGAFAGAALSLVGGVPGVWRVAILAGAVFAAAVLADSGRDRSHLWLGLGLVLAGAVAMALSSGAEGLLSLSLGLGFATLLGQSPRRLLFGGLGAALLFAVALWAQEQVLFARELAELSAFARAGLAGAAFAVVGFAAAAIRHLDIAEDAVAVGFERVRECNDSEIRDIVQRGHTVWQRAADALDDEDENRQILEEAVLRLFHTAGRWSSVDSGDKNTRSDQLVERMEALDARIDKADDAVVIKQYEQAREAMAEQLRYLKDIGVSRERVLARMHNYLAAMERLHLAVVNNESADASREALAGIVSDLQELGEDIDLTPLTGSSPVSGHASARH